MRMMNVAIFLAIIAIYEVHTATTDKFDGKAFFIRNFHFGHANLAQIRDMKHSNKICHYCVVTSEHVRPNQLWRFTAATNFPGGQKGYYYISNLVNEDRLMSIKGDVGVYGAEYGDDQLWRLSKQKGGSKKHTPYLLENKAYPKFRLEKYGKRDNLIRMDDGWQDVGSDVPDNAKWVLVPRYSANYVKTVIWMADNRRGTQDFAEEVTFSTGLRLQKSSEISTKIGLEASLKASIQGVGDLETKFSAEISTSMSSESESTWGQENKITFTAPAGKQYRVLQDQISFNSDFERDNLRFYGAYTIEETNDKFGCTD